MKQGGGGGVAHTCRPEPARGVAVAADSTDPYTSGRSRSACSPAWHWRYWAGAVDVRSLTDPGPTSLLPWAAAAAASSSSDC